MHLSFYFIYNIIHVIYVYIYIYIYIYKNRIIKINKIIQINYKQNNQNNKKITII